NPGAITYLRARANEILSKHPREELRAARLRYNTQQLLAFWGHYYKLTELCMSGSTENESLPLPLMSMDPIKQQIKLHAAARRPFTDGVFIKTNQDPHRPTFKQIALQNDPASSSSAPSTDEILDSLQGRLTLATQLAFKTSVVLYRQFLAQEQQAASDTWDSFRIHVFLDHFLYQPQQGHTRTSRFELIFFANNLRELVIWLSHALKSNRHITTADAADFLAHQTKFYLGLSQRISLEENEILNLRKDLLHYDETIGVVRLGEIPPELFAEPRKLYQELEMSSLGCPFGRSKGIQHNALFEIYRYYDHLFLKIMEDSWEFPRLFGQPRAEITNQSR
ncbi:MAG: hypothetical protein HZB57_00250, partial [Gammaproteobacteria bacterium]|nr:hypothetical protein [Gammaproteobacteria bacterium]